MGDVTQSLRWLSLVTKWGFKYGYCISFNCVVGQRETREILEQPNPLLIQCVLLHKLTVRPHYSHTSTTLQLKEY